MTATAPRIVASMISLNESAHIRRAVLSLGFCNAIYLTDGSSTDDTCRLAQEAALEIDTRLHLQVVPWADDFSVQRNACLDLLRRHEKDSFWWLRVDADEQVPDLLAQTIHEAIARCPGHAIRVRQINLYPDRSHYSASRGGWETHPRLFRGLPELSWTGQVHEFVTLDNDPIDERHVWNLNVGILHYGWLSEDRRKEREKLYSAMPGSGIEVGSLTGREHVVRPLPPGVA